MPQEDHSGHHHMDTDSDNSDDDTLNTLDVPATLDTPEKLNEQDNSNTPEKPNEQDNSDTPNPTEKTAIFGDIDGDGKITSGDALFVLRYSVGFKDNTKAGEIIALKAS